MKKESNRKKTGIKKLLFENFSLFYKGLFKIKNTVETNRKNKQMLNAFKTFIAENPQDDPFQKTKYYYNKSKIVTIWPVCPNVPLL